jgi:hypothetical protein
MSLSKAAIRILDQLEDVVKQIQESDFTKPADNLSGSTIGQHTRHIIEFFICFERGEREGVINYDKRSHNKLIETNKSLAIDEIHQAIKFISDLREKKALRLEVGYDLVRNEYISVETNTCRELIYNIEHAVHHMAIIKIAAREIAPYIRFDHDFGVAASTIRFSLEEVLEIKR